ncbi:pyridoxamine 5'-phosphate oxidase family protein [Yunchengibacter salinarum]|uniref:pyridoxamine 5'-phosphate oxidase family protein n=1 Tax=Yunchengibacter salinarum TaxID=3133399 RepID=UPI0035B668F7
MADFFDHLTDKHMAFIKAQPMFFTATAPPDGRINLSPKGLDTFRVLNPNLVGYLDLTGSGNETAAHLKADGRITIMFNSFTRNPLILRLYGRGWTLRPGQAEHDRFHDQFPDMPGARQLVLMDVESVQTSCGYGVPEMADMQARDTLARFAEKKGADGIETYQQKKNRLSIDGLDTGLND